MINLHKIIYNFLDLTNWPPTPRTGPYDPSSSGGVVAEWVGALDWRPGGPGFESRSDNFASELWQFCLPRFASVFQSILGLLTEWGDRIFQSIIVRGKNENLQVLTCADCRSEYTARHETHASLV